MTSHFADITPKRQLSDLALLGGQPAFPEPLCVGRPNIEDVEGVLQRIRGVLESGRFTNRGPLVREFEERIADIAGVRHCIAMCNATVGLEIVTRALGMSGEVIVPSMTFVATAHALQWQQITPVFCDINPLTHTLDPGAIEALITPRTTGIVGVHLWGQPCDIDELSAIARRHDLRLVFDAAHAFGSSHRGRMVGSFGDAEVFSFHATKVLNTFEGGAVLTDNDDLAEKVRLMQNFGFSGYDNVIHMGTNGKMSEVAAAMGLASLEHFPGLRGPQPRQRGRLYREILPTLPGISLLPWDESECGNFHYVVVEIDREAAGLTRDTVLALLHAENVLARRYFFPGVHRMEPYRSYFPHAHLLLPETERVLQRVLVLPTGTGVGAEEIEMIGRILALALNHPDQVNARLRGLSPQAMPAVARPPADAPLIT